MQKYMMNPEKTADLEYGSKVEMKDIISSD